MEKELRSSASVLLTPNTPLIHTSFTCSKLNMDDFSVPAGPLGYVDSMQEVEWNSIHARKRKFLLMNLHFCVKIHLSMK